MGVPKFYRWLSERYPCLSEVVKEHQIPEFDNLYLDMNGIIHNCSHPNDEDPHFRISEEKIFHDIFHYIEFLFSMIKPQKVFFMAVDGVAPRAKMNQQRGRRFRSARDAEILRQQAINKGEILPDSKQFDSNCITPGTEFMAKLHTQLKFFVTMKISTDKSWQNCRVYLSGHETPGEGEHKIMDFIRYHKSQPDYDPNTRHCLYGLDADLIMLGLCSHEPHFSVLREEVTYGKKSQKKDCIPEQINFHLLHLSLLRDYISHEFQALKSKLSFPFNLEMIIDDWVLMGFLVGNDFIPNIPGLHIHKNALVSLYSAYIEVLPTLEGYINEGGFLNLKRFEMYLKRLAQMDLEQFKEVSADFKYLESKMSTPHRHQQNNSGSILDGLALDTSDFEDNGFEDIDSDNSDEITNLEFSQHKRNYYITKMDYASVTKEVLKEQATEYVRAVQWNLHYYYNGIISWSWYYPQHYAPYVSDVTDFSELMLEYERGQPFLPFQQLLAVLPEASKELLPLPYQDLMTEDDSPLKKFYPADFQLDQNGKQNEWEAIVLIPFIDENLLVSSMEFLDDKLTEEEKNRNQHGPHLLYTYSAEPLGTYQSTLPDYFGDIPSNHARCEELHKNYFFLPYKQLKKGLCNGVRLDCYTPGFPTLNHVPHTAKLKKASVSVFNSPVRNDCMVLSLTTTELNDLMGLSPMLHKEIYVGWPHLKEAKIESLSDGTNRLQLDAQKCPSLRSLNKFEREVWNKRAAAIDERYMGRWGVEIGQLDILVEAALMIGKRFTCGPGGQVLLEKQWTRQLTPYALQVVLQDIPVNAREENIFHTLEQLFPPALKCFCLGATHYGSLAVVQEGNANSSKSGKVSVKIQIEPDISFPQLKKKEQAGRSDWLNAYQAALHLGIDKQVVSRFTGTFLVQTNQQESMNAAKSNIGLNLKFNKKNEEVPGYSKKDSNGNWLLSMKTVEVMGEYLEKFTELFEKLGRNLTKDCVHVDEIFPKGNGKTYVQNILAWLKELPCSKQPRRTCGSMFLDPSVVEEVERIVDNEKDEAREETVTCSLDPSQLYRPLPPQYTSVPDSNANFMLFDRVVNVREGYSVPLGLRGTIIGIPGNPQSMEEHVEQDALYDIVFDEEFSGGISLNCSNYRGYRLNSSALMNLSYGLRTHKTRPEAGGRQRNTTTSTVSSSNSYAKTLHPVKAGGSTHDVNTSPSRSAKGSNQAVDNGMVRLEWKGGKPRQKMTQEPLPPRNTHQFNHSPHSPFVPHLLSSSENKFFPIGNNTEGQFVTPKVPAQQATKKSHQPIFSPTVRQQQVCSNNASGGGQDEFTSIWGELKQANSVFQNSPPSHAQSQNNAKPSTSTSSTLDSNTTNSGFTKVSVVEMFQRAKAAEEAGQINRPAQEPPAPQNAVMRLMEIVYSTTGELPVYKYVPYGPTPLYGAELTIPTWKASFKSTRFHPSKELASENVAEEALLALQKLSTSPVGPSVRPTFPPPFQPAFPVMPPPVAVKDPTLSSAALMLPVVPSDIGRHISPVRAPPPPVIYNIPPSYVAQNQWLASQWEQHKVHAKQQQHQQQQHLQQQQYFQQQKHQQQQQHQQQQHQQQQHQQQQQTNRPKKMSQQVYLPPALQNRKPQAGSQHSASFNINAMEFVPTQVARKQAGAKQTAKNSNSAVPVSTAVTELEKLSLSHVCPNQSSSSSGNAKSESNLSTLQPSPVSPDTKESPSPTTTKGIGNVRKQRTKSRLAMKFTNQPDL